MRGNLVVLIGIPNSGKSTYASKLVQEDPEKYVRVAKDSIRQLLFGYEDHNINEYFDREDFNKLEKEVTRIQETIIYEELEKGKTVIVDSTHLKREVLERLKIWNVPTEIVWFDIDFKLALQRNQERARFVPQDGMYMYRDQYNKLKESLKNDPIDFTPTYLNVDENKAPCVIFDIDGTLAHMNDRSPFDWDKVGTDVVDPSVAKISEIIHSSNKRFSDNGDYNKHVKTIICTGRDGSSIEETENWLDRNNIEYDEIYIRPKGNQQPDWEIKEDMWRKIAKNHNIVGMFDDRLQVVRRARALGLKVFHVEYRNI